nr:15396_t:CDS:2 [Entrophospora candida]
MKYTFFTLIIGIVSGLALSLAWMPVIEASNEASTTNEIQRLSSAIKNTTTSTTPSTETITTITTADSNNAATSATSIINSSNNTKAFDTTAKSSTEYDHKNAAGSSNCVVKTGEVWPNNSSSTYPFGPYPPKSAKTYEEHSLDPALFNDPSMKLTPAAAAAAATTTATPANYYGQSPIGLAQHEPVNYAMDKPQTSSPNVPSPQDMMTTFNSKTISSTPKRYKCEVCQKRFTRPSSLQTHMYSHTGEKLDGCGRHFSVVSNLRRHQKIHGNNNNDGDSSPNVTNVTPSTI